MSTFDQKLKISIGSAALFAVINYAGTFRLTDKLLPFNTYNLATGCPTMSGQLIHAAFFFLITFLTMGNPQIDTYNKIKNSLYGTLIFFLISSPAMYGLTGTLFGSQIADGSGCPTYTGVLLHAGVYCAALVAVMYLPN